MRHSRKVYEAFKDDEPKARVLEEAFQFVESQLDRWYDVATYRALRSMEHRLDRKLGKVDRKVDRTRHELEQSNLRSEHRLDRRIAESESRLLKWSFLFWVAQLSALAGLGFLVWRFTGG